MQDIIEYIIHNQVHQNVLKYLEKYSGSFSWFKVLKIQIQVHFVRVCQDRISNRCGEVYINEIVML